MHYFVLFLNHQARHAAIVVASQQDTYGNLSKETLYNPKPIAAEGQEHGQSIQLAYGLPIRISRDTHYTMPTTVVCCAHCAVCLNVPDQETQLIRGIMTIKHKCSHIAFGMTS